MTGSKRTQSLRSMVCMFMVCGDIKDDIDTVLIKDDTDTDLQLLPKFYGT
jgi:hypothetical protein